ncbi:ABC transporter substrate-binding protein [Anaerolentibacter hominis]|uniref:ABC transporter substrate-binding protein n=1 Tax=Anaerolentibacter hominis TaxID=3079009 RepID=UPI0031B85E45
MKKAICCILVLLLVCGSVIGCSKKEDNGNPGETGQTSGNKDSEKSDNMDAEQPKEVKLALVGPMTGDNSQYGIQFERGAKEFMEEYNARGGTQLSIDIFDDKNDAKEAVSLANKIITDGSYAAIIGPFSSTCALAMAEVTDEEKMITVSPTCSHADYVALYDYTFRLPHVNAYEGEVAAEYMQNTWSTKKVAGIYSNNDWGIGIDDAFVNKAEDLGMDVVANESFIQGQTKDFSSIITKIKQNGAEAVYYMGQYTEASSVLRQIKDMGLDIEVVITTSAYKLETLELAEGAAADAVFLSTFFEDPDNERTAAFSKLVKDKYDSTLDNFILRSYEAADWIMQAFDKCQSTDPDTLRQAMIDVGKAGIDGMSGPFTMEDDRNIKRTFYYCKWNGKNGAERGFELVK